MAGSSFFLLFDDIAAVLDDIAVMSKVAAKKTAGVLGDDLALNAQQVTGLHADRELPVVWAVALGSLKNKLILVPLALAISAFLPWAVIPLLMLGGAFLCFEGFEKLLHSVFPPTSVQDAQHHQALIEALQNPQVDMVAIEKEKILGAIRTDFILSAEIITITLGLIASMPFMQQVAVLSLIGLVMTVGVYGLVAGIVKLDDLGLYLSQQRGENTLKNLVRATGRGILLAAPYFMRMLSIAGTAAMFLVGGSIIGHGIAPLHHWISTFSGSLTGLQHDLVNMVLDGGIGLLVGACALVLVRLVQKLRGACR